MADGRGSKRRGPIRPSRQRWGAEAGARPIAGAGRLRTRLLLGAIVAIAVACSGLPGAVPAEAAAAPASITSIGATANSSGRISVTVRCTAKRSCVGGLTASVAGTTGPRTAVSVQARKSKTVTVRLSAKQLQAIHDASGQRRSVTVALKTTAPATRTVKKSRTVRVAAPVTISAFAGEVPESRTVTLTIRCAVSVRCAGTARLAVGSSTGAAVSVSLPARTTRSYRLALSTAQLAALTSADGAQVSARASVTTSAPVALTVARAGSLRLAPDHGGHEHETHSHAYMNSWTPTSYDTCTVAEHNAYAVTGPDGKLYPGWHPAVHTRADGTSCTFGHEHGDDPKKSSIYTWVLQKMQEENPDVDGIPFGYASERLMAYAEANGGGVHRHEDDPGHKVVISNNQAMLRGPYPADTTQFTDEWGQKKTLTCDFLIKIHQGSHSPDATRNNTHELLYAMKCNDGSEIFTNKLTNFGDPNELATSCSREFSNSLASFSGAPQHLPTSGSDLPEGEGGERHLPTLGCLTQKMLNGSISTDSRDPGGPLFNNRDDFMASPDSFDPGWWWAGYEQWQSFNTIRDTEGKLLAQYEPWFGIQNPSRYWNEESGEVGYLNDLAWTAGNHQLIPSSIWKEQRSLNPDAPIDRKDPRAYFNGAQRDAWLAKSLVTNTSGHSTLYIDPWGRNARPTAFPGSIRVHISQRDNSALVPTTRPVTANRGGLAGNTREGAERSGPTAPRKIRHLDGALTTNRFFFNYGLDAAGNDLGVHAPN